MATTDLMMAAVAASAPWSSTFDGAVAIAFAIGLVAGHGLAAGAAALLRHLRPPLPLGPVVRSVLLATIFLLVVARQGPTQVNPSAWQHLDALPIAVWRAVGVLSPTLVLARAVIPTMGPRRR